MSQKTEKKKKDHGEKPKMQSVGTPSPKGKKDSTGLKAPHTEQPSSKEKDSFSEKGKESLKDKEDTFRESVDKNPDAHASGDFDDLEDPKLPTQTRK
jgi:hypothetical protein